MLAFNLFWYAVVCLVSIALGVKFVTMAYFSRGDLVKALNNNGWSPSDKDYSERIEQLILSHFDLLREELVDEKKFKAFCSLIGSKVRIYLKDDSGHMDRMLGEDGKHKVITHIIQGVTTCLD